MYAKLMAFTRSNLDISDGYTSRRSHNDLLIRIHIIMNQNFCVYSCVLIYCAYGDYAIGVEQLYGNLDVIALFK